MLKRNKNTKKLRFEGLENRTLMAGDVTVAVIDGVLHITGDTADNSIQLKQTGTRWNVQGIDTTINGNSITQIFDGVTDIKTDLGAGNNSIKATKGTLSGNFEIDDIGGGQSTIELSKISANVFDITTHDDADTITINQCSVIKNIALAANGGDDRVTILKTKCDSISLRTGGGNDVANMKSFEVEDDCWIETSFMGEVSQESDQDVVNISKSRIERLEVNTGDDSDTITLAKVDSFEGIGIRAGSTPGENDCVDTVTVTNCSSHYGLNLYTGDGADIVTVAKCELKNQVSIRTGVTSADKGDTIVIAQVQTDGTSIQSRGGNDTVTLTKVQAKYQHEIEMGEGESDQLVITRSQTQDAVLNGGNNEGDTLILKRNDFGTKNVIGFEFETG